MTQTGSFRLTRAEYDELSARLDNSARFDDSEGQAALATITPEKRIAAAALVTEGIVVPLGKVDTTVPLFAADAPADARPSAMKIRSWYTARHGWECLNDRIEIDIHSHTTHIDALGHFFVGGRGFNSTRPARDLTEPVLRDQPTASAESLARGIVTRGVLVDLPRVTGRTSLDPGEAVPLHIVLAALERQHVELESGDAVVFRYGKESGVPRPNTDRLQAGLSLDVAEWLHAQDPSVIITDHGLDVAPSEVEGLSGAWHLLVLTKFGTRLVDMAALEELSETCERLGRWSFQIVMAPLPLPTSGSPVMPLAIF